MTSNSCLSEFIIYSCISNKRKWFIRNPRDSISVCLSEFWPIISNCALIYLIYLIHLIYVIYVIYVIYLIYLIYLNYLNYLNYLIYLPTYLSTDRHTDIQTDRQTVSQSVKTMEWTLFMHRIVTYLGFIKETS